MKTVTIGRGLGIPLRDECTSETRWLMTQNHFLTVSGPRVIDQKPASHYRMYKNRVHCVLYAHNQAALAVINSFGQIHSAHEGTTVSATMALFWQLNGINIICSTFSKFTLSFLFSVALLFRDSLITCSVAAWRFLPLWVSGSMNMTVKRRINFLFHCPSLCLKSQLAFLPPAFFLPTASLLHLTWKYMRL